MEASLRSGHVLLCTLPILGRHLGLSRKIFLFFGGVLKQWHVADFETYVLLEYTALQNLLPAHYFIPPIAKTGNFVSSLLCCFKWNSLSLLKWGTVIGHVRLCTLPNLSRHLGLSRKIFLFFGGRAKGNLGNLLPWTLGCGGKQVTRLGRVHRASKSAMSPLFYPTHCKNRELFSSLFFCFKWNSLSILKWGTFIGHVLLCTLLNLSRHLGLSRKIFLFFGGRAKGNLGNLGYLYPWT